MNQFTIFIINFSSSRITRSIPCTFFIFPIKTNIPIRILLLPYGRQFHIMQNGDYNLAVPVSHFVKYKKRKDKNYDEQLTYLYDIRIPHCRSHFKDFNYNNSFFILSIKVISAGSQSTESSSSLESQFAASASNNFNSPDSTSHQKQSIDK